MDSDDGPRNVRGLRVGQKVGSARFTLVQPLGEGGRGVVWKAADSTLGGMVALKFLPPEISGDPTAIEDLRKETAQSRRLSHPNVVRVYDLFEDIKPFILMELVEGHTLAQERVLHPRKVLPWSFVASHVAQLCDALDYAHSEKVVHRDLKPNNVLIDTRRGLVKLVDFGIARVVAESVTRVTQRCLPDGTLVYMSCQQLNGEGACALDDIYSLGVTLYELMTGKPPFHSGDIAWQIRYGDLVPLSVRLGELEIENDIPPSVEEAVMACLARDPFKRPQSARDAAERLGLHDTPTPTRRTPRPLSDPAGTEPGGTVFALPPEQPSTAVESTVSGPARLPATAVVTPATAANSGDGPDRNRGSRWWIGVLLVLVLVTAALVFVQVPSASGTEAGPNRVRLYQRLLHTWNVGEATEGGALSGPGWTPGSPAAETLSTDSATVAAGSVDVVEPGPLLPRRGRAWTNTLGMVFSPVQGAPLLVARWETRVADYAAFDEAVGSTGDGRWRSPGFEQGADHPVVFVAWTNAVAFCSWLTATEREEGHLGDGQVYRLPTDTEWSAAAGLFDEPGRDPLERARRQAGVARFSWGTPWPPETAQANLRGLEVRRSDLSAACVEVDDGFAATAPVGSFPAGSSGLYDLTGNVWEWCEDVVGVNEANRIVRGGSWDTFRETELLLTHRDHFSAGTRLARVGFRCVLDPGP